MDNDNDNDGMLTAEEMREMLLELKAREASAKENQKFLVEFIEMYHEYPCLWKYGDKDYRNRYVKNRAYDTLLKKMKEIDPRADRNSVMRKINALRTAFRREYKKVRQSVPTVNTTTGVVKKYSPSLWYYDLLKFVVDQQDKTETSPGVALMEWQHDHTDEAYEEVDEEGKERDDDDDDRMPEYYGDSIEDSQSSIPKPSIKIEPLSPSTSSRGGSPTVPTATSTSGPNHNVEINSVYSEKDATTTTTTTTSSGSNVPPMVRLMKRTYQEAFPTDLDRFGVYVATKLKRSSRKQSIIAEKVIAEVLMRANLGTLEETTTLTEATATTTTTTTTIS